MVFYGGAAESETAAYSKAAKDVRYVTNVLGAGGFNLKLSLPVTIKCDNQAAVASIKNNGTTQRNRHYERWLQYGREQYLDQVSAPLWIGTDVN